MEKFTPIADRVLVLPDEQEKEKGGLILDASERDRSQKGTVISVGPGNGKRDMVVKEGDRVAFGLYNFQKIKLNDVEHYIFTENQLHGIINTEQ